MQEHTLACAPLQMSSMGTSNAMIPLIINKVPQFTVRPPKKIERYLGQSVKLNCSADGHPVPIITWSRCKGHITEGRTQLMESGQLKINSLTAEDSDPYSSYIMSYSRSPLITFKLPPCSTLFRKGGTLNLRD